MSKRILFVIAAVALLGAGVYYRAANAHTASVQAGQIVASDVAGKDSTASRSSLKDFVHLHMGSSVNLTLKGSFDRAQAAASAAATAPAPNSQVYADAQRACSGKSDSITQAKCNQAYLAAHLTNIPTPIPVPAPKIADYQYSFAAPLWTPDLAGALLTGAVVALVFSFLMTRQKRGR